MGSEKLDCQHEPVGLARWGDDPLANANEATLRERRGEKQTKCPNCGLLVWDGEWNNPKTRKVNCG